MSLSGGSTDYPSFYQKHGSFLVGFAINEYVYLSVKYSAKIHDYHTSVQYSSVERVQSNKDIKHNGVRGTLEYLKIEDGLEISTTSDLPKQTGVGSSSAFCVGLVHALRELTGKRIIHGAKYNLANDVNKIEREILKEAGGRQDPIYPAYGGLISVEINRDGNWKVKPIPIDEEAIWYFEQSIVLAYTGSSRNSFEVAAAHDNPASDEHKLNILSLSKQLYKELCNEDFDRVGEILHESWIAKQKIANGITNPEVDRIYQIGRENGAIGGKLLGAGVGGMMLFIVEPSKKRKLMENLGLYCITPKIDFKGSRLLNDRNNCD